MPRRRALTGVQIEALLALPTTEPDLIRHYTLSPADLAVIARRRRPHNRLGFAVQLCYLRFPGVILGVDEPPFPPLFPLGASRRSLSFASLSRICFIRPTHLKPYQTATTTATVNRSFWILNPNMAAFLGRTRLRVKAASNTGPADEAGVY